MLRFKKAIKFIQKYINLHLGFFSCNKFYQQLLKVLVYPYFINVTIISWRIKINCMNVYVIKLCNVTRNNISLQPYKITSMTQRNVVFFCYGTIQRIILMPFWRNLPPQPSQDANVSLNWLLKENRNINQRKKSPLIIPN